MAFDVESPESAARRPAAERRKCSAGPVAHGYHGLETPRAIDRLHHKISPRFANVVAWLSEVSTHFDLESLHIGAGVRIRFGFTRTIPGRESGLGRAISRRSMFFPGGAARRLARCVHAGAELPAAAGKRARLGAGIHQRLGRGAEPSGGSKLPQSDGADLRGNDAAAPGSQPLLIPSWTDTVGDFLH